MQRPSRDSYDVIVFGGGPAGAAASLAIARRGLSVAVLSKPARCAAPIGETVPPTIVQPLAQLGLRDEFRAAGHAEAPGSVVIWGDERPYENDFIFNPYSTSWHLDRVRFDAMLLAAAHAAGAAVYQLRARRCVHEPGGGWTVRIDGAHRTLTARWLVDATGRAAWLGRHLGAKRHRSDGMVALVRFAPATVDEPRTLIETCSQGWWYAAALPENRVVAAFFTDADLLPHSAADRARLWDRSSAETHLIKQVFPVSLPRSRIQIVAASSGRALPFAGKDWLAVGDASIFYDPLSGQGILKALSSALQGAEALCADLLDNRDAAGDFVNAANRDYQKHVADRSVFYRREQRWPEALFWQRRHSQQLAH